MAGDDELVQHAERAVVEAAMEWAKEKQRAVEASPSPASERLRTACYMLHKARTITGKIRTEDVERAMREQDEKKR